jgi:hypothetical protein
MKRLVLLFDGTWNTEDGATHTNIVRLREILAESLGANRPDGGLSPDAKPISGPMVDGIEHLVFYDSGVGTGLLHDRILGGSIGVGITTNIRQGYRFLSRWYVPGDEIYVFGFSRGAYTARSLVGYVAAAGLLQSAYCTWERENEAWSFYRTPPKDRLPGTLAALSPFVHAASQLRIKCLGVFDTVGALGVPLGIARRLNARNHQFHDVVLGSITDVNLHAIAIDEHRRPFEAAPWTKPKFQRYKDSGRVEQVWFPGAHADVGGGYPRRDGPDSAALEDIALDWMIRRVNARTDLRLYWRGDVRGEALVTRAAARGAQGHLQVLAFGHPRHQRRRAADLRAADAGRNGEARGADRAHGAHLGARAARPHRARGRSLAALRAGQPDRRAAGDRIHLRESRTRADSQGRRLGRRPARPQGRGVAPQGARAARPRRDGLGPLVEPGG